MRRHTYAASQMDEGHVPGLALGVVQGDQAVHLQGFGTADGQGSPVSPETPFIIASVTKSFTALAVMQLVEHGQVQLDAPVVEYLPWLGLADDRTSSQITVRELLYQTSGIPSVTGSEICNFRTPEEAVRSLANGRATRPVCRLASSSQRPRTSRTG